MNIEIACLAALAGDQENDVLADIAFAEPVLSDPDLSRDFVRMHIALEGSSTRLERDERLAEWLCTLRTLLDEAPAASTTGPARRPGSTGAPLEFGGEV